MEPNRTEPDKTTRREILKKAGKTAAFIAPSILTLNLEDDRAYASGLPTPPAPPPWK